ncbi:hypothetical protein P5V15_000330 [Pogonomyrmex californicus]
MLHNFETGLKTQSVRKSVKIRKTDIFIAETRCRFSDKSFQAIVTNARRKKLGINETVKSIIRIIHGIVEYTFEKPVVLPAQFLIERHGKSKRYFRKFPVYMCHRFCYIFK